MTTARQVTLSILALAYGTLTAIASDDPIFSCIGSKKSTLAEIAQRHADTEFEKKFSLIAANPHDQGEKNLSMLTALLKKEPNYSKLLPEAKRIADDASKRFVLEHSTRFESLGVILESGALIGGDELIRRGISKAANRIWNPSLTLYDGEIGEQDVVYIAYQPKSQSGQYGFGDLTFVLDSATFEKTYFTLNSFAVGSSIPETVTPEGCDQPSFEEMRKSYRAVTFQGADQARRMLVLSALQAIKNRELLSLPAIDTAINASKKYETDLNAAVEVANRTQTPYVTPTIEPIPRLCSVLQSLGQASDDCSPANAPTTLGLLDNFKALKKNADSDNALVSAYTTFPKYDESKLGFMYRPTHWFWEVKAPRQLSLDHVTEIILPVQDSYFDGNTKKMVAKPRDTTQAEQAIQSFAKKRGWTVIRSIFPKSGKISLKFKKS